MHLRMNPTDPIFVPARTVASRVMGDSALLIHPEADEIKLTNEVGTLVWRLVCERRHTAGAIARAVVEAFDVDAATAEADVASFLDELSRAALIERVEP
jgi:hypothetical protein